MKKYSKHFLSKAPIQGKCDSCLDSSEYIQTLLFHCNIQVWFQRKRQFLTLHELHHSVNSSDQAMNILNPNSEYNTGASSVVASVIVIWHRCHFVITLKSITILFFVFAVDRVHRSDAGQMPTLQESVSSEKQFIRYSTSFTFYIYTLRRRVCSEQPNNDCL